VKLWQTIVQMLLTWRSVTVSLEKHRPNDINMLCMSSTFKPTDIIMIFMPSEAIQTWYWFSKTTRQIFVTWEWYYHHARVMKWHIKTSSKNMTKFLECGTNALWLNKQTNKNKNLFSLQIGIHNQWITWAKSMKFWIKINHNHWYKLITRHCSGAYSCKHGDGVKLWHYIWQFGVQITCT